MSDGEKDAARAEVQEPWLLDDNSFSRSEDREYIAGTLQYIKDHHVPLTLIADGGGVYQPSLLTKITDDSLQLDKPLEWDPGIDSFRAFFRDMNHQWNFFPVRNALDYPFSLAIAWPETLKSLQRRSCSRIKVPAGTRALVRRGNEAMATVFVRDLSVAGMLICNDPAEGEYLTDSIISDIIVSIPPQGTAGEVATARKVLPLISQGRIVRSFVDQETNRPCYGVSFCYDSSYVKDTISQVISEVERDILSGDDSAAN